MTRSTLPSLLLMLAALLALGAPAGALPIEASVGTGPDLATVVLEFQDGASYAFEVSFDDSVSTSGVAIMQALETELASFTLTILDFGFGLFIDAISYAGHSDSGFGGGELYWHYWTKNAEGEAWTFSEIGAIDRIVSDGAWEGWRYGAGAPIPEPSTSLLIGFGLLLLCRQSRGARQSSSR